MSRVNRLYILPAGWVIDTMGEWLSQKRTVYARTYQSSKYLG